MLTREDIRWGYLMLLGREPEDEQVYAAYAGLPDIAALRMSLVRSAEGLSSLRSCLRAARSTAYFNYFQPLLVFLHMEKTGGTSLYEALAVCYGAAASSPPHLSYVPEFTLVELNQFAFVSGHFSFQEAMALPRSPKTVITMFREPIARLISFYRFHRAHPPAARSDPVVCLAQDLGAADFFRHPDIAASTRVDHAYLHTFAPVPPRGPERDAAGLSAAYSKAVERIDSLAAFGLTEEMDLSARLIGARIGIDLPARVAKIHSTDGLRGTAGFAATEDVVITDELRSVVRPLVEYDVRLYDHVSSLFRKQVAAITAAPPSQPGAAARIGARIRSLRARS